MSEYSLIEKKKAVYKYIRKNRRDILVFYTIDPLRSARDLLEEKLKDLDKMSLDALVLKILTLSISYCSKNKIFGGVETYAGRRRSSIDIWRHAKCFQPGVSILDIMDSLYRICRDPGNDIKSIFCSDIKRRVFRFYEGLRPAPENEWTFLWDEYGLEFPQWENINSKRKKGE